MSSTQDIWPDGDLVLVLGVEQARLRVSRAVMRLSSPVWDTLFGPKYSEGTLNEVELPEDDPTAMYILMLLAHHRFTQLPKTIPLHTLGRLAELCDKYAIFDLVRKWLPDWLGIPSLTSTKPRDGPHQISQFLWKVDPASIQDWAAWLWIAWLCKRWFWFKVSMYELMGAVPPSHLQELPDLPPFCKELVIKTVEDDMGKFLDAAYRALAAAQAAPKTLCSANSTVSETNKDLCALLRLGMISRFFILSRLPQDIDRRPLASNATEDLNTVAAACVGILPESFGNTSLGSAYHQWCFSDFDALVRVSKNYEAAQIEGFEKMFEEFFPELKKSENVTMAAKG